MPVVAEDTPIRRDAEMKFGDPEHSSRLCLFDHHQLHQLSLCVNQMPYSMRPPSLDALNLAQDTLLESMNSENCLPDR